MSADAAGPTDKDTRLKRFIRAAENHEVISVLLIVFIVVMALLGMANAGLEVAERAGFRMPSPRPASAPLPIGYIDPVRLAPADPRIELLGNSTTVLKEGDDAKVVFLFNGMQSNDAIDPGRRILVAMFRVQIDGRMIGGALDRYIKVESVYDRTKLQNIGAGILEVVDGDVLAIIGHNFRIERVWSHDPVGRDFGDPENSVILTALR